MWSVSPPLWTLEVRIKEAKMVLSWRQLARRKLMIISGSKLKPWGEKKKVVTTAPFLDFFIYHIKMLDMATTGKKKKKLGCTIWEKCMEWHSFNPCNICGGGHLWLTTSNLVEEDRDLNLATVKPLNWNWKTTPRETTAPFLCDHVCQTMLFTAWMLYGSPCEILTAWVPATLRLTFL